MEYIDLYDRNHRATGEIWPRSEPVPADRCSLVISFWIRDAAGRLFLEQRSPDKRWFPGWWECGGGCAQAGETGFDAATREVAEETGLTPGANCWRLLGELENEETLEGVYFHHWNLSYLVTLEEETPALTLQGEEVANAQWLTPQELDAFCETEQVTVYTRRLWSAYRDQLTAPVPKVKQKKAH